MLFLLELPSALTLILVECSQMMIQYLYFVIKNRNTKSTTLQFYFEKNFEWCVVNIVINWGFQNESNQVFCYFNNFNLSVLCVIISLSDIISCFVISAIYFNGKHHCGWNRWMYVVWIWLKCWTMPLTVSLHFCFFFLPHFVSFVDSNSCANVCAQCSWIEYDLKCITGWRYFKCLAIL